MAELEQIWDAIARQAALVEGIKAAYGTGAGDQGPTVELYPEQVLDGPVAVVDYLGSEIVHGGFEKAVHSFALVLWVPRGNGQRDQAVRILAPFLGRVRVAFDANVGLFGVLGGQGGAEVTGSGPFEDTDVEGTPYLVQAIQVEVWEAISRIHSMGPPS
jgi:hypothetical protein